MNVAGPEEGVRTINPGQEQLPEGRRNPLRNLATELLTFSMADITEARPVALKCGTRGI